MGNTQHIQNPKILKNMVSKHLQSIKHGKFCMQYT